MADSRFTPDKFIIGDDKAFIQAHVKDLKDLATKVYVVPPRHAKRMDLISDELYNTTELKWLLIYINDIIDISVVEFGYKLKYVPLKDVTALLFETSEQV